MLKLLSCLFFATKFSNQFILHVIDSYFAHMHLYCTWSQRCPFYTGSTVLGPKGVLYTKVPLYLVSKVSFLHWFGCTWSKGCPLYKSSTVLGIKGVLYTQVPLYLVPKVSFIHRFHCTWSQGCPLYAGSIICNFYKGIIPSHAFKHRCRNHGGWRGYSLPPNVCLIIY